MPTRLPGAPGPTLSYQVARAQMISMIAILPWATAARPSRLSRWGCDRRIPAAPVGGGVRRASAAPRAGRCVAESADRSGGMAQSRCARGDADRGRRSVVQDADPRMLAVIWVVVLLGMEAVVARCRRRSRACCPSGCPLPSKRSVRSFSPVTTGPALLSSAVSGVEELRWLAGNSGLRRHPCPGLGWVSAFDLGEQELSSPGGCHRLLSLSGPGDFGPGCLPDGV